MGLHRHHWVAVSAQIGRYVIFGGDGTSVLYRCSVCGKARADTINGHWTVDQLNGTTR